MWILKKNSKELLENQKTQSLHSVDSIKSFGISTLYTTIPHDKLKSKLKEIINQCFFHKNGNRRISVCCHWLQRHILRSGSLWCATKILRCKCHKDAGISNRPYFCGILRTDMSANNRHTYGYCAPLLADFFLYSYEAEFVQSLLQAGKKHLAQQFNFTYRYIYWKEKETQGRVFSFLF